jgi:hypothetical protein
LERLLPRYTTLGDMWQRIRWQADAPGLDARNSALRSDFDAIRKLLDAGDADNAGPRLEQFASRLVGDWEANERARTAGNTRAEYQRLLQSVPERYGRRPVTAS